LDRVGWSLLYVAPSLFLILIPCFFACVELSFVSSSWLSLPPPSRHSSCGVSNSYSWLCCGVSAYQSLALEHMKEMRVRRMRLGTRQRYPVQAGTGAKAPPDLPCEILAVFPVELVILWYETAPSAASGSADGDAVDMRPRAPVVSAPPIAHTDAVGAAAWTLVHADETETPEGAPALHSRAVGKGSTFAGTPRLKGA
jgi:hypothetical protein